MNKKLYLFEEETFKERCERELKETIWDCIDANLKTYIEECEIEYEESLYIPLLCELIAMGTYLPHKWFRGEWIFTSKKLPKPISKCMQIGNIIHERLLEENIKIDLPTIEKNIKRINIQKKRPNKYFNIDKLM